MWRGTLRQLGIANKAVRKVHEERKNVHAEKRAGLEGEGDHLLVLARPGKPEAPLAWLHLVSDQRESNQVTTGAMMTKPSSGFASQFELR